MNLKHILAAVCIGTGLMTSLVFAIPGRAPDLEKTADDSTLIVVGELVSVDTGVRATSILSSELREKVGVVLNVPKLDARVDRGVFRIDEVLKGENPGSSITFEYLVPYTFIGWMPPEKGIYGVFFFRRTESGALELTTPYFSWVRTIRGGFRNSTASAVERVIEILGTTLNTPTISHEIRTTALLWLQFSKSNASNIAMRTALNDPELEMRLNVSGALMFKGDSSGLEVVKTAFLAGIPLPANFEELVSNQVSELGDLHDPKLVPDLEQLLGSNSLYMRRGASFALMRTRSPDAKTGLKKALVDSDLQVRFNGVVGLAEIGEEREWRPSLEEFRANESRYLSHFSK